MYIGGKQRPIKVGVNQGIIYCELREITINDMYKDLNIIATNQGTGSEIRDLLYSVLKDGARVEKQEFDHTNYEVGDWLETITEEAMAEFMEALIGGLPKPKKGEDKKKVGQKKH